MPPRWGLVWLSCRRCCKQVALLGGCKSEHISASSNEKGQAWVAWATDETAALTSRRQRQSCRCAWIELKIENQAVVIDYPHGVRRMESPLPPLKPGTLYLVATPIGNLEDITLRALRTLKECDVVAAEDTRHTAGLLQHHGISKPLISYFKFNEARRSEEILQRLGRGEKVALVTDSGTPGISDPGERVVRAVLEAGLRVEPVPGPCALIAGLIASGLPAEEFHFVGFLAHKSGQRRKELERLRTCSGTLVLYESPFRIEKLLMELAEIYPERQVVLARELTKKFEEFLRGTAGELLARGQERKLKGEFVVLVGPESQAVKAPPQAERDDRTPTPCQEQ